MNEVKELTWASKSPNVKDSLANLKDQAQKDEQFLSMSPGNAKLLQYLDVLVQKVKGEGQGVKGSRGQGVKGSKGQGVKVSRGQDVSQMQLFFFFFFFTTTSLT